MLQTIRQAAELELSGGRPGVPHGPRGCLTDYRGLAPHTSTLCLTYDVKHLRASKFKGKCEHFFTKKNLQKNRDCNF